jgi:hypothetical protein
MCKRVNEILAETLCWLLQMSNRFRKTEKRNPNKKETLSGFNKSPAESLVSQAFLATVARVTG